MDFASGAYTWLLDVQQDLKSQLGQSFQIKSIEKVSGGSINEAAVLQTSEGRLFIKWNSHKLKTMFEAEKKGLDALKHSNTDLIIPQSICLGSVQSYSYLVLEFLEFISPQPNSDEALGRGLAKLHQTHHKSFGFEEDNFCGSSPQQNKWTESWSEFYLENRLQYLWDKLLVRGDLTDSQNLLFKKFKKKVAGLLDTDTPASLIHGDLWSGNAAYTARGPCIFDPACYYAHREAELGMMLLFGGFGPEVISGYEDIYPLEKSWTERVELYQLYHLLNHFWLFGGGYGNSALAIVKKFSK